MAAEQEVVYECRGTRPSHENNVSPFEYCEKPFAAATGLSIVETVDDGDCFFDAFVKYYKKYDKNYEVLPKNHMLRQLKKGHASDVRYRQHLRHVIVNFLKENKESLGLSNIGINNNALNFLEAQGVYAADVGDLPNQYANQVYQMNVYIYIFNSKQIGKGAYKDYITLQKYHYPSPNPILAHDAEMTKAVALRLSKELNKKPNNTNTERMLSEAIAARNVAVLAAKNDRDAVEIESLNYPTIHLLRIGGHYKLLVLKGNSSSNKRTTRKKNSINAASAINSTNYKRSTSLERDLEAISLAESKHNEEFARQLAKNESAKLNKLRKNQEAANLAFALSLENKPKPKTQQQQANELGISLKNFKSALAAEKRRTAKKIKNNNK